ncbi:MAG: hypothetical protein J5790_00230 [Bacteroidaceae bacterium]|nr:hypothetical protein [Bacteroidaceae bacterium]
MEDNKFDIDQALRIVMKKIAEPVEQMKLSDDFTDRLMERIRREEKARKMALRRRRIGFAVGIAAALALLVGVALHVMHGEDEVRGERDEVRGERAEVRGERGEVREMKKMDVPEKKVERLWAYVPAPMDMVKGNEVVDEEMPVEEEEPLVQERLLPQSADDGGDVCWILIPNTPFALRYSLMWESGDEGATKANVSAVECVTIEENDTVLIKSPSGEISKGSMYVYEGEKKENDFVYVRDGRLLTADIRIYYKKAFLNADGQTYSYIDALALLDYPTCSLCMND